MTFDDIEMLVRLCHHDILEWSGRYPRTYNWVMNGVKIIDSTYPCDFPAGSSPVKISELLDLIAIRNQRPLNPGKAARHLTRYDRQIVLKIAEIGDLPALREAFEAAGEGV